jgi:hypothetical protein
MLQTRNKPETTTPFERLEALLKAAKAAGADAAEAVFAESRSLSVGVRKGALEAVERDETADLGLRVFVGRKQAVVSVSEFSQTTTTPMRTWPILPCCGGAAKKPRSTFSTAAPSPPKTCSAGR